MTRPTLPGLVALWKRKGSVQIFGRDTPTEHLIERGVNRALNDCAAELSQAVALTDEEREALVRIDRMLLDCRLADYNRASSGAAYPEDDAATIRALVTRLTAASDGGGKGEGE